MTCGRWGKSNPFRNRPMRYLRKVSLVQKEHGICLQFITDPGLMGSEAAQGSQGHCPARLSMGGSTGLLPGLGESLATSTTCAPWVGED